ncbi:MAG TPA: DNA polymerase III subunit gamma/tau, partial [Roseiarcus sp.]|nr:DNA polymerase III subunit gamma/tau [Roseiarcus sp.]
RRLQDWTGERWMVALTQGSAAPTLREVAATREAERANSAAAHPLVRKVLERFSGARIVEIREPKIATTPTEADDDVLYADSEPADGEDY